MSTSSHQLNFGMRRIWFSWPFVYVESLIGSRDSGHSRAGGGSRAECSSSQDISRAKNFKPHFIV